ncbi:CE1759 family FMN reductase [Georgenia sp. Z1344]|uniref:CE1759 family FMN reductase n=1 Tax=Georgenia sp. Z1344 TaxID=3416706 RepID=UPI003CEA05E8
MTFPFDLPDDDAAREAGPGPLGDDRAAAGAPGRRIVSVSAGTSQPSSTQMLADRLGQATVTALREQGVAAEVTTVDLRDHAHDILNAMLTGVRTGALEDAMSATASADGLVVTTPVYSGSYSGLLKMFLDILDQGAIDGTPLLIGATGGTPRHSLAIDYAVRPLVAYLRGRAMSTGVYAATDDWAGDAEGRDGGSLPGRIARAGGELATAVAAADPRNTADEFDAVPDFSSMLRSMGA